MHKRQNAVLASLRSALDYADRHPLAPEPPAFEEQRERLRDLLRELDDLATRQQSALRGSRAGTTALRAERAALRLHHLRPLRHIFLPFLGTNAELLPLFDLPRANTSLEELVGRARAMADAARPFARVFVRAGRPADFVERVHAAARRVEEADAARTEQVEAGVEATAALAARLELGRNAVAALDAMYESHDGVDDVTHGGWRKAQRVRQAPGPKRKRGKRQTSGDAAPEREGRARKPRRGRARRGRGKRGAAAAPPAADAGPGRIDGGADVAA